MALSYIIWRAYDPKSLLFFVVALMGAEAFIKVRWRIHMVCRNCGFDPVVYVKNPEKAAEMVKNFLEKRAQDPAFLLRKPLNLPRRTFPAAQSVPQQSQVSKKSLSLKL